MRVKEALKKTAHNMGSRLALIYDLSKTKHICEGAAEELPTNPDEFDEGEKEAKSAGCGRYQPTYRRKEIEIHAEWKKHANDESHERKIILTAERVLEIFKGITDEDCVVLGKNNYFYYN